MFSNGILVLALAASALLIGFGGVTTALIPLYAVGVFTSSRCRRPEWSATTSGNGCRGGGAGR